MNDRPLLDDYLESLPPDERRTQARAFKDDPLLRLAVERAMELSAEERKVLMAEFELYAETGEVEPGSLFDELLEEAHEVDYEAAVARSRAAGGRSELLRFLDRAGYRGPNREFEDSFSQVDSFEQSFLYLLFEFCAELALFEREGGGDVVARIREQGIHAVPLPAAQGSIAPQILIVAALCAGSQRVRESMESEAIFEAARQHREFAADARHLREKLPWGYWCEDRARAIATGLFLRSFGLGEESESRVHSLISAWQKLIWVAECIGREGIFLGGKPEPISPSTGAALLVTLADSLQPLLAAPELLRELPLQPNSYLYPRHANRRLLESLRIRAEPELASAFIDDIRERRHYALDHIARVELGGRYGIDRITLAPERWYGNQGQIGYIVKHNKGSFLARTMIGPPGTNEFGWPALSDVPVFGDQLDGLPVEEFANLYGHLTVLALAAWRNIVVPRVRDEHYEVHVRRKPKASGKRAARQARRGDLAVIEYMPRLLVIREEEERARRERGEDAPLRTVYRVGVFTKRLPEGQRRSAEATAFAKEIGIPVADWQTIVKPHWRGGTAEEREAAELAGAIPVKEWRSWDALDVLNAR